MGAEGGDVPAEVAARLEASSAGTYRVVATRNRVHLVSVRRRAGLLEVRVSRRLDALGSRAAAAVADFVVGRRGSRDRLRALFAELPPPSAPARRRIRLQPVGAHHDLDALCRAEAFAPWGTGEVVPITWGRATVIRRRQRSIKLGSYRADPPVIRIHPALDNPHVPAWYIGTVVHHELLHHALGVGEREGRRVLHPRALREREREHPRYGDARAWEAANLAWILAGRGGPPASRRGP